MRRQPFRSREWPKTTGRVAAGVSHWRMAHPIWPLFDLRIRTPRLELRLPSDDDVFALAELAAAGVHPPDYMPFNQPWTDIASPDLERNAVQHYWAHRAQWRPEEWNAGFAVECDGRLVGVQGLLAREFGARRTVSSGSWLG